MLSHGKTFLIIYIFCTAHKTIILAWWISNELVNGLVPTVGPYSCSRKGI